MDHGDLTEFVQARFEKKKALNFSQTHRSGCSDL